MKSALRKVLFSKAKGNKGSLGKNALGTEFTKYYLTPTICGVDFLPPSVRSEQGEVITAYSG